jgi:MFS family permease
MMRSFLAGDAFRVIHNKNFRLFLIYRIFVTMAALMQSVIIGWQVYDLTHNVLWLGFIGLVEVVPQVCISLFAGHYIDLLDRRKIMKYTTFILLLSSVILLIYSSNTPLFFGKFGALPLFLSIFLSGLARGVLSPAQVALLGQLVPRNLYANAATWNSATWQTAAVLGPAIGGIIYGFIGIIPAYSIVLFFDTVALFMIIIIKSEKNIVSNNNEGVFPRIKSGINFVFNTPELLGAFALDMFAVLFGGAVAMLPVFASDVLLVGPQGLGLLRACPAIGAIIMSFVLMFNPPVGKTGRILFIAVVGFGLCIIGFAISTSFILSCILLILSGAFDNISVVIRGTILQLFTPNEMRGRVASVNCVFIGSSNELGAFESGVAAKIMGLVPSVIFGGIMTLAVVTITVASNKSLRRLSIKDKF